MQFDQLKGREFILCSAAQRPPALADEVIE
jgi:hypothetical protein